MITDSVAKSLFSDPSNLLNATPFSTACHVNEEPPSFEPFQQFEVLILIDKHLTSITALTISMHHLSCFSHLPS